MSELGVYIKGMKMPRNCEKCLYLSWSNFYQIYVCNAVRKNEPVLFDGKQTKSTAVARSARADNCPLIPVPDHGRLIDADALHEEMYALEYARENEWLDGIREARGVDVARVALLDAPTIIPADREVDK